MTKRFSLFLAGFAVIVLLLFQSHYDYQSSDEYIASDVGAASESHENKTLSHIISEADAQSKILDNFEKKSLAETYVQTRLVESLSNSDRILYFEFLNAEVDEEETNQHIQLRLIWDIDPDENWDTYSDLYLHHFYAIKAEYIAEYDPSQYSYVEGKIGRFHITSYYYVFELDDGAWQIEDNQFCGAEQVE